MGTQFDPVTSTYIPVTSSVVDPAIPTAPPVEPKLHDILEPEPREPVESAPAPPVDPDIGSLVDTVV